MVNFYTGRKYYHASPGENLNGPELCFCGLAVGLANYTDGRDWNKISKEEFVENKKNCCPKCFQEACRVYNKGVQKTL